MGNVKCCNQLPPEASQTAGIQWVGGITKSQAAIMQPGRKKAAEQNCSPVSAILNVCSAEHQFSAQGRNGALV